MDSLSAETMMMLHNYRFVYSLAGDINVVVVTHDNLYWIIVQHKMAPTLWKSNNGHKTEGAVLQGTANYSNT
ncbi:unnamed protein product [Aureobasidium vineae]|uniref:Uncharacterized protein n=1 Tax=Aureobasidium vineae TaxID=2773715 RepID=A0A9N8JC48_9PEZI|nr:unnamed protein product [Aureobasidium vineae]